MARIEVAPEDLEQAAVGLSRAASDICEISGRIQGVRHSVEDGWQSNYTTIYTEGLETLRHNLLTLAESTQEISDMIRQTAADLRRVEEENRRLFSGSGGGGGGGGGR